MKRLAIYPASFVILFLLAFLVGPAVSPAIQSFAHDRFGFDAVPPTKPVIDSILVESILIDTGARVLWVEIDTEKDTLSVGFRVGERMSSRAFKEAVNQILYTVGNTWNLQYVSFWVQAKPGENSWVILHCSRRLARCAVLPQQYTLEQSEYQRLVVAPGWEE